jgi:hypothetical protein
MVTRSEAEIEQELITLREQHAATLVAIQDAEAELVPLNAARSPADAERARQEAEVAEQAFRQADEELGRALVARNTVNEQRSQFGMQARRLADLVAEAEVALAQAQRAADPEQDLLASIRARLFGGAA